MAGKGEEVYVGEKREGGCSIIEVVEVVYRCGVPVTRIIGEG